MKSAVSPHKLLFFFQNLSPSLTAVPSLHFSSARGPAGGAVVTRSHNPESDVPAAVSVTQKNTFSWVRKKKS